MIPYASGLPVAITGLVGGLLGTSAAIGMGIAAENVLFSDTTIDLTGSLGTLLNFAMVIPRDGVLTDFSAFFSVALGATLLSTTIIQAFIYKSISPTSNTFERIVTLNLTPALGPIIVAGQTRAAHETFSPGIPVTQGERLLVVFGCTSSLATAVTGYASAGIGIS